jgi:hypothetical protein
VFASKWNKIEHRLFSFISINWRGKPLLTYKTIISLIASTKTKTGLKVLARLNKKKYKKGIKVSNIEMQKLNIHKDKFHGEWNYNINPRKKLKRKVYYLFTRPKCRRLDEKTYLQCI